MKFREYGELEPITISETSEKLLSEHIDKIGQTRDIVDLQFSTAYNHTHKLFLFSALLLVKKED